jgi:hypothetical protein
MVEVLTLPWPAWRPPAIFEHAMASPREAFKDRKIRPAMVSRAPRASLEKSGAQGARLAEIAASRP